MSIYAYIGEGNPVWAKDESGNMLPNIRRVCMLKAAFSGLQEFMTVQKGPEGQDFWKVDHSINVQFGSTALKARMTWYEGVTSPSVKR